MARYQPIKPTVSGESNWDDNYQWHPPLLEPMERHIREEALQCKHMVTYGDPADKGANFDYLKTTPQYKNYEKRMIQKSGEQFWNDQIKVGTIDYVEDLDGFTFLKTRTIQTRKHGKGRDVAQDGVATYTDCDNYQVDVKE